MEKYGILFVASVVLLLAASFVTQTSSSTLRSSDLGPKNAGSGEWNGSSYVEIGGNVYYIDAYIIGTWQLAWLICEEINMTLISLDTKEKNELISTWLDENWPDPDYELWSSGHQAPNGEWIWKSTGKPIEFSDWATDRPDEDPENELCMHFHNPYDGWEDARCSKTYTHYMCEYPPGKP